MALPFFYIEQLIGGGTLPLDEDTSRHVVQVLRMQEGEELNLTDGLGQIARCTIQKAHKRSCEVKILDLVSVPPANHRVTIAISLLKNHSRFEWFLEKATELGVTEIIPLICHRTEKQHFRYDRMKGIVTSAMLQSQQCRMPVLQQPQNFGAFIHQVNNAQKLIAHCDADGRKKEISTLLGEERDVIVLIGPEGDFTPTEVQDAISNGFLPVSLGETRLRTETAGMVAATLCCLA